MALFSFATGLTLRRGEQQLDFRRNLQNGQIQFEDPLSGQIYNWPLAKLYREINSGELAIFSAENAVVNPGDEGQANKPIPLLPNLESLSPKYRKDLERKLDYVNTCKKQGLTRGKRQQLTNIIRKIAIRRGETPPSTSSVMGWWRKLDRHDLYPSVLVSGNTQRRRQRKLSDVTVALVRKILRTEYFTRARHSLARSHLLINAALGNIQPQAKAGQQRSGVSLATVRRIANEVTPYHRDVARYGPGYAKNKWRYSLNGTMTRRVLERVEVDHTKLDVVVVCDRSGLPLGRPTLTVAIDAHSGYVISFFISFWGTGLGPTLNALKIAISPKDSFCEGNTALENPWLGYGLCELIVVDNGLEFHSPQFQLAAWHLNADIQYCAVRQPWLKPSVERILGSLGMLLPEQGRVYKPISNYLPPNPRATACVTFSQLCNALLKCFVDILPMEVSERTLMEPFEIFREGFERLPPPLLPSSFKDIELIGAMSKTLTVGNEGVVFNYLRYNSTDLQNLRRQTAHTFKTLVKFHPENLDFVYVQDPKTKSWLLTPSCQPEYTYQLSIVQHRAIRALLKQQLEGRDTVEKLMRGKLELIAMYDDFLRGNKGKKNIQAAQKFGALTSTQTLMGASSPALPAPSLVISNDFVLQNRVIPTFSSFKLD